MVFVHLTPHALGKNKVWQIFDPSAARIRHVYSTHLHTYSGTSSCRQAAGFSFSFSYLSGSEILMYEIHSKKSAKSPQDSRFHPLLQSNSGNDSTGFSLLSGIITSAKWTILHPCQSQVTLEISIQPTLANLNQPTLPGYNVCFVNHNWIHYCINLGMLMVKSARSLMTCCGYSSVRRELLAQM